MKGTSLHAVALTLRESPPRFQALMTSGAWGTGPQPPCPGAPLSIADGVLLVDGLVAYTQGLKPCAGSKQLLLALMLYVSFGSDEPTMSTCLAMLRDFDGVLEQLEHADGVDDVRARTQIQRIAHLVLEVGVETRTRWVNGLVGFLCDLSSFQGGSRW